MSKTVTGCIATLIGVVIGFAIAAYSFNYALVLDYDSGFLRDAINIGPFTVRTEEHCHNYLGQLMLPSGRISLVGNPSYKIAARYYGDSRVCASTMAGILANEIVGMDAILKAVPRGRAVEIKETFLRKLNSEGENSAMTFLLNTKSGLLDEVTK